MEYQMSNKDKYPTKSTEDSNFHTQYDDILCGCDVKSDDSPAIRHAEPLETHSYEWSRLGPMGYLREPQLYSINGCSTPIPKVEDPDEIKSWEKSIPESISKPISPLKALDILRRINDDRLRSTYQTDYDHMDDYPWADYENLMTSVDYKTNREFKKPHEEINCRKPPKLPYLNGHEIPGRRSKDSTTFGSFPFNYGKLKRPSAEKKRKSGPEGINFPLQPANSNRDRKEMSENKVDDDSKNTINNDKKQPTGSIEEIREATDKKSISDGQQAHKKDEKRIDKAQRITRNSQNDALPNIGKTKNNIDEFQIISSDPCTSEYQDIINRTADDILRTKLHHYGKMRLAMLNPDCP